MAREAEARARVLLHEQDGSTGLVHVADQVEHDGVRLRIEPHRRLIEHEELRVEHERARELDDLLLTTGERRDALVAALGNHRKRLADVLHPARR